MKKILTIVITILVIIGVFWFFYPFKQTEAPAQQETEIQKYPVTETTPVAQTENSVVYEIKGINFAFDLTEIRVQEGDTVTIQFESTTGFHDWVVDEFNAKTAQVNPGTPTSVTFVADKIGEFEYYCSVGQHRAMGMVGKLIVEAK